MQPGVDAFVILQKKVLLIQRDNIGGIQNPNKWCLPGGGIETGETELGALQRELKEEINLELKEAIYLDNTHYSDGNVVSKFLVFMKQDQLELLKLREGQRFGFFSLSELERLDIIPNLRNYLHLNGEHLQALIEK